jgi:hypothetical protein
MYQADITQNVNPAQADPSSMMRAIEMQAGATSNALKFAGQTGFDVFRGYQEEGVRQKLEGNLAELQADVDLVKMGDAELKADFATTPDSGPLLEEFKARQQALVEARNQLPKRYKEFMLRSSADLKNAIAAYPGLADAFRSIAGEVTGKQGLELYGVSNLYEEIGFIEKMNEAAAKQAAQDNDQALKSWLKDAGPVMGETVALNLFNRWSEDQKITYITALKKSEADAKQLQDALAAGGEGIQRAVTIAQSQFDTRLITIQAPIYQTLAEAGVSRADIAIGNISPEVLDNPKVQEALNAQLSVALSELENYYVQGVSIFQSKVNDPIAGDKYRTAYEAFNDWYKAKKQELTSEGSLLGYSKIFAQNDPQAIQDNRFKQIKSIAEALQLPQVVIDNLSSSNPAVVDKMAQRFPEYAKQLAAIRELVGIALTNGSHTRFNEFKNEIGARLMGGGEPPINKIQQAASAASFMANTDKLARIATGTSNDDPQVAAGAYVQQAFVDPSNASVALKDNGLVLSRAIAKMGDSEKKAFQETVKKLYEDTVFATSIGHGALAKELYERRTQGFNYEFGEGELRISAGDTPESTANFAKYGTNRPLIERRAKEDSVREINKRLNAVDMSIRLRALVTGESVDELRQQFRESFVGEGTMVENITAPVASQRAQPVTNSAPKQRATMAEITQFARENNVSIDEAITQLRNSGYTVD